MVGKIALVVVLALSLQDGCEPGRSGSDRGGDNDPTTGACEISYEETVGGRYHRYPELVEGSRFVFGKVIVRCERSPQTHYIQFHLQTRRIGDGQGWRQVKYNESRHVPSPVEAVSHQADCDPGRKAFWRIYVKITGTGVMREGRAPESFEVEDYSAERLIACP
jgi:hypothetical protein